MKQQRGWQVSRSQAFEEAFGVDAPACLRVETLMIAARPLALEAVVMVADLQVGIAEHR